MRARDNRQIRHEIHWKKYIRYTVRNFKLFNYFLKVSDWMLRANYIFFVWLATFHLSFFTGNFSFSMDTHQEIAGPMSSAKHSCPVRFRPLFSMCYAGPSTANGVNCKLKSVDEVASNWKKTSIHCRPVCALQMKLHSSSWREPLSNATMKRTSVHCCSFLRLWPRKVAVKHNGEVN